MRILVGIIGNAVALWATTIVPGISFHGDIVHLLLAGALFGLFNWIVRPIALLLSLPLIFLTLGIFYLILNGILLWAAQVVLPGYSVRGIVAGILGSLVITVVNWILHAIFGSGRG